MLRDVALQLPQSLKTLIPKLSNLAVSEVLLRVRRMVRARLSGPCRGFRVFVPLKV